MPKLNRERSKGKSQQGNNWYLTWNKVVLNVYIFDWYQDILQRLEETAESTGDKWRSYAYRYIYDATHIMQITTKLE